MTDDELTDAWETCQLGRSVTHAEHVRVSWVLISRHGAADGISLIAAGTLKNCIAMNAPDRFDPALTARWSQAIAKEMESSDAATAAAFLTEHPRFLDSQLFGPPTWTRGAQDKPPGR